MDQAVPNALYFVYLQILFLVGLGVLHLNLDQVVPNLVLLDAGRVYDLNTLPQQFQGPELRLAVFDPQFIISELQLAVDPGCADVVLSPYFAVVTPADPRSALVIEANDV